MFNIEYKQIGGEGLKHMRCLAFSEIYLRNLQIKLSDPTKQLIIIEKNIFVTKTVIEEEGMVNEMEG